MEELGLSMINLTVHPADVKILRGKEITAFASVE
jgi:hypothetical protein